MLDWAQAEKLSGLSRRVIEKCADEVMKADSVIRSGFRVVRYPIPRGCATAYCPETNVLAPLDNTAETSNPPNTKSIIIRVEPAAARDP